MSGPTIEQVDAVVRSVLAAMLGAKGEGGGRSEPAFPGRLLSLRQAEILASQGREIRLAPGTVITPLARDYLKHQGVAVRWVSAGSIPAAEHGGEWGFVLPSDAGALVSLRRQLLQRSDIWHDLGADPGEAFRWVPAESGRGAVVLTDESAVVAWRANQVEGIRAASVGDTVAVAKATRTLGANLLVIEPPGKSIFELLSLFTTFRRSGPPILPAWLGDSGAAGDQFHADRRGRWSGYALAATSEPQARPPGSRPALANGRLVGGILGAR